MLNYIDLIFVFVLLSSVVTGWQRGFILGVLDLVRWFGSLLIGLRFYPYLAGWLARNSGWNPVWIPPLSFLIVALLSGFLIQYAGALLVEKLPADLHHKKGNQVLGLVPGLVNGLISAAILAVFLLAIPLPDGIGAEAQASKIAARVAVVTDRLESALSPVFGAAANQTLTKLTVDPESRKMVRLPYKVATSRPRPDLEAEMLKLVNRERRKQNLPALQADTALTRVARLHSADMFRRAYFSHYSPEGRDPFDRIRQHKIRFLIAGENLALAPTLTIAHEGLMNSPGHRANILQKRFGRVGIGVMEGGFHRLMITQNFRN
jgi:uncharacterized protein YkwD/uncharacterized membrane protein required for colicin V production